MDTDTDTDTNSLSLCRSERKIAEPMQIFINSKVIYSTLSTKYITYTY